MSIATSKLGHFGSIQGHKLAASKTAKEALKIVFATKENEKECAATMAKNARARAAGKPAKVTLKAMPW